MPVMITVMISFKNDLLIVSFNFDFLFVVSLSIQQFLFANDKISEKIAGNGLKPLNVALRCKQKPCALFLLTKQWSKRNYNGKSILLSLYAKMKRWADISRERVILRL